MICPGLVVNRAVSILEVQQNVVNADPIFYSYYGCTCAAPLVPYYHVELTGALHISGAYMFIPVVYASPSVCVCI